MSWDFGSAIGGALQGWSMGGPWGAVAGFVIGGVAGGDAKRSARNKARDAANANLQDRQVMVQSSLAEAFDLYGRVQTSGPIVFACESGAKKEYLHLVIAIAPHEVDAFETIYLDDTPLTLDGTGNVTNTELRENNLPVVTSTYTYASGGVATLANTPTRIVGVIRTFANQAHEVCTWSWTPGSSTVTVTGVASAVPLAAGDQILINYEYLASFTPLIRVKTYTGTTTQTADTDLISESGGQWTAAHRLRGVAYLYIRARFNQDVFGSMGLPNFKALVRGMKILDPRTGTTVWTDNAALVTMHYLRSKLGVTTTELTDAMVTTEANVCDENVAIDGVGGTEKRYTFNGGLSTTVAPRDNLEHLCQAMLGFVVGTGNKVAMRAGRHVAAEFTITEDWLADGPITIQPDPLKDETYNRVVMHYLEPLKSWQYVEGPPVTSSTYLAEDGGEDLPLTLNLVGVRGAMRAQRLSAISLARKRYGSEVVLTCSLLAYDCIPGSVVALQLARFGFAGSLWEVISRRYSPTKRTVTLRLRATAAALWTWAYTSATTVNLAPTTSLENPIATPAALTITSVDIGTGVVSVTGDGTVICNARVNWTQSADRFVTQGGTVEVRYARADTLEWVYAGPLPGGATSVLVGPLQQGFAYHFAVRPVTVMGKAGAWALTTSMAGGKTVAPSNVAGFTGLVVPGEATFSWTQATDKDYLDTELRQGASWAAGTPIFRGAATRFSWPWPAAATYTVWAKHHDTSGNESAVAQSVTLTFDASGLVQTGNLAASSATQIIATEVGANGNVASAGTSVSSASVVSSTFANSTSDTYNLGLWWSVEGYTKTASSAPGALELLTIGITDNGTTVYTREIHRMTGPAVASTGLTAQASYSVLPGHTVAGFIGASITRTSPTDTDSQQWTSARMRLEVPKR